MTSYLSRKINNLSAISILLVIYIHMYYTEGARMPILLFIENTFGGGISRIAVPLFYIISGYLFFLKMPDGLKSITGKLRKRVRTLLVPYLLANTLTFFFWLALSIVASRFNAIGRVVNFDIATTLSEGVLPTMRLVLVDPPIAFQLWFVRDLMIVMLFSPMIYGLIAVIRKRGAIAFVPVIAILLVFYTLKLDYPFSEAFFWFTLGGVMTTESRMCEKVCSNKLLTLALSAMFLALSIANGFGLLDKHTVSLIPLVGIPAIWCSYDLIAPHLRKCQLFQALTSYTFFVYLIHEPFLNIFKKLPVLVSTSEQTLILSYLFTPPLFFPIACYFGSLLKKHLPKFYSVYTGSR